MPDRPHIFDLDRDELRRLVESWAMPPFRADQVLRWVYPRGVTDPRRMSDLSKADRRRLADRLAFHALRPIGSQLATDGTRKLLLELSAPGPAGEAPPVGRAPTTECVMIPARTAAGAQRRTACISSQVGCPVGCLFCASGLGGLERNLTAGQIVEQVWHLNRAMESPDERVTNIVFMGMGEPLTNFEHVTRAIRTLAAPWGFGISARRTTLSTVGLPAQIRRLADRLDLPITLAISLHAPNDALRARIIPWADRTSVEALIDAGRYYFEKTGREVTLEYILLGGVNDRPEHARQLATVAKRLRSNVNLIRYNEVAGLGFDRPATGEVLRFQHTLRRAGVNVHIRASRGRDIAAACGQLRHEHATAAPRPPRPVERAPGVHGHPHPSLPRRVRPHRL